MSNASSPIQIGKRTCKNRITMAPTVKFASGDDGIVTDEFPDDTIVSTLERAGVKLF